ncbi:glycosyltransferase [Bdellovibrio sp. ArHS]|uniref:glycosyltransferase n=1 Tax=Bdellovibrio sp. ArHS TaxID=1569284 RepID=UPI0025C70990|nr:glycosyltransferase [Bdellovibrio sp. ArHS]
MAEPKHIVFVTEHLSFGGAEVVLTTYLKSIDPNRYKISLIVRDGRGAENYLLKEVPPHIHVQTLFDQTEIKSHSCHFRAKFAKRFDEAVDSLGKVDVIVDFSPVLDKIIYRLKKRKMILWMHGDKSHMGFWERLKYRLRIRQYDKIVLLCNEMKDQFQSIFPELQDKLCIIPNPFDFDKILAKSTEESDLSVGDRKLMSETYIVSVARLVPGKDFKTIIEAGRILKERGYSYKHYIIGDGELREELQSLIDKYGLNNQIFLLGAKQNPYPWMKKADFFVHSANREGFGLAIVEAMYLGKAVIATRCPVGPAEILQDGKAGLLFPLNDADVLAGHIANYIDDLDKRRHFSEVSQQRARDFSSDRILPLLYRVLDSV